MNNLDNLQVDLPRGVVVTTRGEEIPIKEHSGWRFINYQGKKIGISKLRQYKKEDEDPVYNYIFDKGFLNFPCPAMDYWIIRHRMAKKITYLDFKVNYKHTFVHHKPKQL